MNDLELSMNERKYNVAEILSNAKANDLIDFDVTKQFFLVFSPETEIYKYTGDNDVLLAKMDNEILNNTLGFKGFLESYANVEQTITVYQVILSIIV